MPGVVEGEPIVKPLPPEPAAQTGEKEPIRIGNWDVRISGSIAIDVAVGNLKPPRRSNR